MTDKSEPVMVERVARAICLASSIDLHGGQASDWTVCIDNDWPSYAAEARAAIGAMREPTEGMIEAAVPAKKWVELAPGYSEPFDQLGCTPKNNWQRMIDTALSGSGTGEKIK